MLLLKSTSQDGLPCLLRSNMLVLRVLVRYKACIVRRQGLLQANGVLLALQLCAVCALSTVFLQYRHWSSCIVLLGIVFGVCCFFFAVDVFICVVLSSDCFLITVICVLSLSLLSPFNPSHVGDVGLFVHTFHFSIFKISLTFRPFKMWWHFCI